MPYLCQLEHWMTQLVLQLNLTASKLHCSIAAAKNYLKTIRADDKRVLSLPCSHVLHLDYHSSDFALLAV